MIADVLSVYGSEVVPHRATSRNIAYCMGSLLKWWGDKRTTDITTDSCRDYAKTKGNNSGAASDLKILHAATKYWHEHQKFGPLFVMPKFWRPDEPPPRERYLTRQNVGIPNLLFFIGATHV